MEEYGRIKSGATRLTCNLDNWTKRIDIVRGFECPPGFLPIDKDEVKPADLADGEILWFDYETVDGRLKKHYRCAPPPKRYSKLKIYLAIASIGAWPQVQSWLEAKAIDGVNGWLAFQLAQEISDDHPLFAPLAEEARRMLHLTQEQFYTLLSQCILEE